MNRANIKYNVALQIGAESPSQPPAPFFLFKVLTMNKSYSKWCWGLGSPTNSLIILYISTWKRSDLFLATLCASKLATWRRKEGCDADGNSINHTVAQYAGPIEEGDRFYLERRTGNNVSTKIEFDPLRRRPIAMETTLSEGGSEESFYRLVRHSCLKSRSSTSCLAGKTISSSLRLSNIEILIDIKEISRFRFNNKVRRLV